MNTYSFFSSFIFETVSTMPYRLLAYCPFRRQLRFPGWVIALAVGITQVLHCSVYALLSSMGNADGARASECLFAPVALAVFLFSVQADRWKTLFLYIFIFDYNMMVRGTAHYVENLFFYSPSLTFTTSRSALLSALVLALTLTPMYLFLKWTKTRIFHTEAPAIWRVIWLLPASTTAIVMMYTHDLTPESIRQSRFFLSRVLLLLGSFVLYYLLLCAMDSMQQEAEAAEKVRQQEFLLSLQHTQYSQISRHVEEMRHARHDLSHHLRVINGFLSSGKLDELKNYVANYSQSLQPMNGRFFCQNYAVNTIANYYMSEALEAGIDFSAELEMPPQLPIDEIDLCSILGNLLENALTASRSAAGQAAFIRVLARADGPCIDLAIDNSSPQKPTVKDGRFLSSSHEGYGIGTVSVRTIAEKHQGVVSYRYESGVFYASVSMIGEKGKD